MKSRQKITRVQLNVDAGTDFLLFGVVSAEPDYKLSLALNRKLGLSLKHKSPLELQDEKGSCLQFSRFSDQSRMSGQTYNLIANKNGKAILIKKLNKIDYLLQVHSPEGEIDRDEMTSELRTVDSITAVFPLEPDEIRDKNLQYLIP
jgi:hypothetical protein